MKHQAPYYPDYMIKRIHSPTHVKYVITTLLRHKHEGTWYTQHFIEDKVVDQGEARSKGRNTAIKHELKDRLMKQVYLSMLFYKVDPERKTPSGELLDPVDELQDSEKERLGL
jgi:hypothetical protein